MKNQFYMLAFLQDSSRSIPVWAIVAAAPEYDKISEQYKAIKGERLMLSWSLTRGVYILRANLNGTQMTEDFTNIEMPLDNIAGHHRAGLYAVVYNSILDFLKE